MSARDARRKTGRKAPAETGFRISKGVVIVGLIALAVVAGVVALSVHRVESRPCTPTGAHEHATFGVFASGTEIRWTGPLFDYPRAGSLAGHIHQSNPQTIHMESPTNCITLGTFFVEELQSKLTRATLTLDTVQHHGESFQDGAGGKLRFFLGEPPADWRANKTGGYLAPSAVAWSEQPGLPDHQPRDGEYLLVDFGNESDETIRAHQLSLPRQDASEGGAH